MGGRVRGGRQQRSSVLCCCGLTRQGDCCSPPGGSKRLVSVPVKQDPQINIGYIEGSSSSFGYLHHEVDQCSDISEGRTVSIFRVTGSGSGVAEVVVNKGIYRLHQKEKIWPIRILEGEEA